MESDEKVTFNYAAQHVALGIASLKLIIHDGRTVKHLKFDW